MTHVPNRLTYVLLGRPHWKKDLKLYSADISVHCVEEKNEKLTYIYYGYVIHGSYYCKEIALGSVNLEWSSLIKTIIDVLDNALHDYYLISKDFRIRLIELRQQPEPKVRFEKSVARFIKLISKT